MKVCTWLRQISSCSCLTVLPGPAWVLLSKTYKPLFTPLYIVHISFGGVFSYFSSASGRSSPDSWSPCAEELKAEGQTRRIPYNYDLDTTWPFLGPSLPCALILSATMKRSLPPPAAAAPRRSEGQNKRKDADDDGGEPCR